MKSSSNIIQLALLGGAVVLGVLLDRMVLTTRRLASVAERSRVASAVPPHELPAATSHPSAAERATTASLRQPAISSAPADEQSLEAILAERDPRRRLRALQAFVSSLSTAGYPDALQRIRQITSSNERELASRLLVAQWAQSDPDGALQFAAGHRGFEYVAEDVFQQMAGNDFETAMTRAQAMPEGELRYRALRGVLGFKTDTDPQGALVLAQTFGDFRGSEPLATLVYRQWAANDPQAAALHAAGQGQGESWRSPVFPVVQTWAAQDPAAAAKWSLSLEDAQAQSRSVAQVMRQWSRDDPSAAANWIHALEPGTARDAAVAGLAQSLVMRDPQTALSWIGTMSDDPTRTRALQRISGTVMWRDPQNGSAMLQAAGLPADQIRDFRRRRDQ